MYRDGFPAPLATSRESPTHVSIAWFQCYPGRFITIHRTTLIHVFTRKSHKGSMMCVAALATSGRVAST
jgi:hypothetical protein